MFKSKTSRIFFLLILLFFVASPFLVLADPSPQGLVKCGNPGQAACESSDLTKMIGNVFDFIAFTIVPLVAVIGFVIAGIIMMTSGGDPGKFNQGKNAMIAIAVGLAIVYLAWVIVKVFIDAIGGADWTKTFLQ